MEEADISNATLNPEDVNARSVGYAMTYLRAFDEAGRYAYSILTIEDDGLKALLYYFLSHHPSCSHWEQMSFASKFEPLIHNWSRLNDLVENGISDATVENFSAAPSSRCVPLKDANVRNQAIAYLKELLQQVKETPGLETYFNGARETQDKVDSITFEYLWTIFPPGEVVISRAFMGRPQAFIVKESQDKFRTPRRSSERLWNLECWSYDWNGAEFDRVPVIFTFQEYKGPKSISTLSCFPIKYYKGASDNDSHLGKVDTPQALEKALIQRGKRFRELCLKKEGSQHFEYNGFALTRGEGVRKQPSNTSHVSFSTWIWILPDILQDDVSDYRIYRGMSSTAGKLNKVQPKRQMACFPLTTEQLTGLREWF